MDWIQVGSLALLIIGAFAWIHSDIRTIESRLDTHIVAINERVDAQNARSDQLYADCQSALRELNARSDQLYIVMIDHLKEQKEKK